MTNLVQVRGVYGAAETGIGDCRTAEAAAEQELCGDSQ